MATKRRLVDANDLHLFAVHTGSFYQKHLELARNHEPIGLWDEHFANNVVPLYCKQIEPVAYTPRALCEASETTKAYYERHIAEF